MVFGVRDGLCASGVHVVLKPGIERLDEDAVTITVEVLSFAWWSLRNMTCVVRALAGSNVGVTI